MAASSTSATTALGPPALAYASLRNFVWLAAAVPVPVGCLRSRGFNVETLRSRANCAPLQPSSGSATASRFNCLSCVSLDVAALFMFGFGLVTHLLPSLNTRKAYFFSSQSTPVCLIYLLSLLI